MLLPCNPFGAKVRLHFCEPTLSSTQVCSGLRSAQQGLLHKRLLSQQCTLNHSTSRRCRAARGFAKVSAESGLKGPKSCSACHGRTGLLSSQTFSQSSSETRKLQNFRRRSPQHQSLGSWLRPRSPYVRHIVAVQAKQDDDDDDDDEDEEPTEDLEGKLPSTCRVAPSCIMHAFMHATSAICLVHWNQLWVSTKLQHSIYMIAASDLRVLCCMQLQRQE